MWTSTWALNTCVGMGKDGDWMVHSIGESVGAYTDATHGMTLSAVSIPYYKQIMPYGLAKFRRYAVNVWDVDPAGKTDSEIAQEGLGAMESYMRELGLVMNVREIGVTDDNIEGIARGAKPRKGYKALNTQDVISVLKESMSAQV